MRKFAEIHLKQDFQSSIMKFIYNLFIQIFGLLIKISSLFDAKAKKWIIGRKNIFEEIEKAISSDDKVIWMHTASLGEFEQGRPVLEALRKKCPAHKLLLTFFSPSGYEIKKNYDQVDHVFYLPLDTPKNAKRFIKLIHPELAIFVKYEFWFNYINELNKNNSPTYFISSIFRADQYFFKWYGAWFRKQLKLISHFFVQNETSIDLLNSIGIYNICLSGDTRFDRVYDLAQQCQNFPLVEKFKGEKQLFIAGSTWPPDENILIPLIEKNPELKFIIAPHETKAERVWQILKKLGSKALLFSDANEETIKKAQVLIIDSVGILAHLYQYADICYIGGGFGVGIHNIQEPVTFGKPVIFGPNFEKFREARDLLDRGGAFAINDVAELGIKTMVLLSDKNLLNTASSICISYVDEMRGATEAIMRFINTHPKI